MLNRTLLASAKKGGRSKMKKEVKKRHPDLDDGGNGREREREREREKERERERENMANNKKRLANV